MSYLSKLNLNLLKKRKLGVAVKYNYDAPTLECRFYDRLIFPKNFFDKLIGSVYEKFLPSIQFFIWNEKVQWARESGYTLTENFFHHFRHANAITMHAIGQMLHPYGLLNAQRRDQMIRRTETLLPGIEIPDWAQETRRVHDLDYESVMAPFKATNEVNRESTPAPHINFSTFTTVHNIFEGRWQMGYSAQRLYFNEELRGDFYRNGLITENERKIIHGWYGDSQGHSQKDRIDGLPENERAEVLKRMERWTSNFRKYFPEVFDSVKTNKIEHKYEEPYYERNMNDIRGSIFTSKWLDAIERRVFNEDDQKNIEKCLLEGDNHGFFTISDGEVKGNETYIRFIKEFNLPDVLKLDRISAYPPEKQFIDALDKNWGINFDTVDTYRRLYLQMIKSNNSDSKVNSLVLEEVYNPFFRKVLQNQFKYEVKQTESFVLKAIEKGASVEELTSLSESASGSTFVSSSRNLNRFVYGQIREIVRLL